MLVKLNERPPRPKIKVNGREVMRIDGVYMYVINKTGAVGAIMGFHPMLIVFYEDPTDEEPIRGYLRIDRWIYPLARSFSPIYVWDTDRIIFPEPFSPLQEPTYIVIRLPLRMSRFQKDTLWNLLDISAHLRGTFKHVSPDDFIKRDRLFELTEITSQDQDALNKLESGTGFFNKDDLSNSKKYRMDHKLLAAERQEAKLSICFGHSHERTAYLAHCQARWHRDSACQVKPPPYQDPAPSTHEYFSPLSPTRNPNDEKADPGGQPRLKTLPIIRGNTMRVYILGPRDPQHIKISTVMEWIPVTQLIFSAVNQVFKEQVRLRREKELIGVPPTFEGRKLRLFGGWGSAERLNEFGVARPLVPRARGPYTDLTLVDPAYSHMFQEALTLQNLEQAAGVFDYAIKRCKLTLLSFASSVSDPDRMPDELWLGPLIPRALLVRYRKLETEFLQLMTVSATVESDLVYHKHTNYLERIHEDCEHHYPKLRPRNPLLDPQYPYPREPSPYIRA